jgi:hypothetical protein
VGKWGLKGRYRGGRNLLGVGEIKHRKVEEGTRVNCERKTVRERSRKEAQTQSSARHGAEEANREQEHRRITKKPAPSTAEDPMGDSTKKTDTEEQTSNKRLEKARGGWR